MTYKPYSIMCPPYDHTSGGIRVMYGLRSWLEIKGQIAFMNARLDTDFIAIYPEIYEGNSAGAKHVVRYILNKPGVMGGVQNGQFVPGPTTFPPEDIKIVFSKIYDTFNSDENHLMFLPILNLHLFKDQHRQRTKSCFYVGKGKDLGLHPKDAVGIFKHFFVDQGALADLLNECEVMYTYENPTAMVEIARLCGCKVVFFPAGATLKYTKNELDTLYEPGMEGVGWNEPVDFDPASFRSHYVDLGRLFSEKLDRFIDFTQSL